MFICLTDATTDCPIVIRCDQIIMVRKEPEGKLQTLISTALMGPRGPVSFLVKEEIETVGLMLNKAFKAEVPVRDLGFEKHKLLS